MKLLLDAARLLATKLLAVVLVAAAILATALLWQWNRERDALNRTAATLRLEVEAAQREWRTNSHLTLNLERQIIELEAARPNPLLRPADYFAWSADLEARQAALEAARAARARAHALHQQAKQNLAELEVKLDDTWTELLTTARRTWWIIAAASIGLLFGPMAWKAFWYWGVAPLARRAAPLSLIPPQTPGTCRKMGSGKALEVEVRPDEPLMTRMEWLQAYSPHLRKRTRFLYSYRFPFVSYASGLREMTQLTAPPAAGPAMVTLTSADDPHAYVTALALDQHPGVVLKPGAVIAVSGDIRILSRWRWFSLHAWIAGRIRHLLFAGTGTVYVTGHGGIDLREDGHAMVVEEALVLGYDGRAEFSTARTETFWPYFRNRTSLFDYRFGAGQPYLRQTAAHADIRARANPFTRTVEAILSGVGRFLGF